MEEFNYPSIQALQKIYQEHEVEISVSNIDLIGENKNYHAVKFSLKNQSFQIFVDDEYKDFQKDSPLLSLCLVLRELENYRNTDNYLAWCKECVLDSTDAQIIEYYSNLESTYNNIKLILGEIDSQISDFEFGLNAGAARKLRKLD